jgi:hypothetical protein
VLSVLERDAVDLPRFAAGVGRAVRAARDALGVVETFGEHRERIDIEQ